MFIDYGFLVFSYFSFGIICKFVQYFIFKHALDNKKLFLDQDLKLVFFKICKRICLISKIEIFYLDIKVLFIIYKIYSIQ